MERLEQLCSFNRSGFGDKFLPGSFGNRIKYISNSKLTTSIRYNKLGNGFTSEGLNQFITDHAYRTPRVQHSSITQKPIEVTTTTQEETVTKEIQDMNKTNNIDLQQAMKVKEMNDYQKMTKDEDYSIKIPPKIRKCIQKAYEFYLALRELIEWVGPYIKYFAAAGAFLVKIKSLAVWGYVDPVTFLVKMKSLAVYGCLDPTGTVVLVGGVIVVAGVTYYGIQRLKQSKREQQIKTGKL